MFQHLAYGSSHTGTRQCILVVQVAQANVQRFHAYALVFVSISVILKNSFSNTVPT